jgi:hypothetical protein
VHNSMSYDYDKVLGMMTSKRRRQMETAFFISNSATKKTRLKKKVQKMVSYDGQY